MNEKLTVTTVILAIAEQPLRNATVIAPLGTPAPAGSAVPLTTNVRRFIGSIAAVVIGVAVPTLLDAPSVLAGEFRVGVARPRVTDGRILVASVAAVVVAVALPRAHDAASGRVALELVLGTGDVAVLLVRAVAAVVRPVAQRRRRRAVVVGALELAGLAETLLARARLVRTVAAVRFPVAFPVERDAAVVLTTASVLTYNHRFQPALVTQFLAPILLLIQ